MIDKHGNICVIFIFKIKIIKKQNIDDNKF